MTASDIYRQLEKDAQKEPVNDVKKKKKSKSHSRHSFRRQSLYRCCQHLGVGPKVGDSRHLAATDHGSRNRIMRMRGTRGHASDRDLFGELGCCHCRHHRHHHHPTATASTAGVVQSQKAIKDRRVSIEGERWSSSQHRNSSQGVFAKFKQAAKNL